MPKIYFAWGSLTGSGKAIGAMPLPSYRLRRHRILIKHLANSRRTKLWSVLRLLPCGAH